MTAAPQHDRRPAAWDGEEYLPDLLIEPGRLYGLVQIGQSTGNGEHSAIEIHPSQVLYIAQKLGMVRELTGDEAAAREAMQFRCIVIERDLARLRMAVDLAATMAQRLHKNIIVMHNQGHEDLNQEIEQALALVDLLDLINEDPPEHVEKPTALPPAGNAAVTPAQRSCNAASVTPVRAAAPAPRSPTPSAAPGLFDGGQP